MKSILERWLSPEDAAKIERETKKQSLAIEAYLETCKTIDGYLGYKIGWLNEDFENKKITVRVFYKDGFTNKKFK